MFLFPPDNGRFMRTPTIKQSLEALIAAPSVSSVNPQWDQGNRAVIELLDELKEGMASDMLWIVNFEPLAFYDPLAESRHPRRETPERPAAEHDLGGGGELEGHCPQTPAISHPASAGATLRYFVRVRGSSSISSTVSYTWGSFPWISAREAAMPCAFS